MKTLKFKNPEKRNAFSGLLITCVIMFMFGCQKEETSYPGTDNSNYSDQKNAGCGGTEFAFIEFDHYAANSFLPDYSLTVRSNGMVVFEGRKNVAFVGRVQYDVSVSTINELKLLFGHSDFLGWKDEIIWCPDLPINTLTYVIDRGENGIKILHDRDSQPVKLAALREKAEELLQISKYIIKTPPVFAADAATAIN